MNSLLAAGSTNVIIATQRQIMYIRGSDINPQEEIKYFNDINKLIIYRAGPCHSIYHLEISIGLKT